MSLDALCLAVKCGDVDRVAGLLQTIDATLVNASDRYGFTPLMHAVRSPVASPELVRLLLRQGADPNATGTASFESGRTVLSLALGAGDPEKVTALLEAGADPHYSRDGYGALLDAVHGRDIARDDRLLPLLAVVIGRGAALDTITSYAESGLRVLSRVGRFDAVAALLAAGADASQLGWTPLIRAVALGTLADVEAEADSADLEARDFWQRTAWLVAVSGGDIGKASFLRDRGADVRARGRCAKPTLFYAIEAHRPAMLAWLLAIGIDPGDVDQFGSCALTQAAECGNLDVIDQLLAAGLPVDGMSRDPDRAGMTPLWHAVDAATARQLLDAGADPQQLQHEQRRLLLGLPGEPDVQLLDVSPADLAAGRSRRFGTRNPELMSEPFWTAMVRSGVSGYTAAERFGLNHVWNGQAQPVWCAQRFGQSLTFLPDGRIVQVAGEHEDSYDPDFCIYNDVFVHEPDGTLRIYGYPESEFPPTDFHTATCVGNTLWLIGSLGYPGSRRHGETQVFVLDLDTFRIERVATDGETPGWISRHRAVLQSPQEIRISGGMVAALTDEGEAYVGNEATFVLDLVHRLWRRAL